MSHGDPGKWHLPGWRIEQRYSPGVLIGNWGEERYSVSYDLAHTFYHYHSQMGCISTFLNSSMELMKKILNFNSISEIVAASTSRPIGQKTQGHGL